MKKFDELFSKIGQMFVRNLQMNVKNQIDINGNKYSPIKPSTAEARQRKHKKYVPRTGKLRKGKVKIPESGKRLFFTERFWLNGFKYNTIDNGVEVYVNPGEYPIREGENPIRYTDIVDYNNLGSPSVNKNIKSPPLIFPNNINEVEKMDAYKYAVDLILESFRSGEIYKEIEQQIVKDMKVELKIHL